MNDVIKFKAFFLTKALKWVIIIGLVISVLIFSGFNIDLIFRYLMSMLIVFSGIVLAFYLNRNEPEKIDFKDENVEIYYFNKFIFKREISVFQKQEIESQMEEKIIKLFTKGKLLTNIRKPALNNTQDWEKLNSYFFNPVNS